MKEYALKSDHVLECDPALVDQIADEILDAMTDIAEKYGATIGGIFSYDELKDEEEKEDAMT